MRIVIRTRLATATLAALLLGVFGCGGYGNPSPTGPDGLASSPEGAVVINVTAWN